MEVILSMKERGTADLPHVGLICSCPDRDHPARRSTIQLQVKTILNRVQRFVGFVYREVRLHCRQQQPELLEIEISIQPHRGIRGRCSRCQRPSPGYDRQEERRWLSVPLWGIPTYFRYAPRRVTCHEHGIVVEHIPWSDGKRPVTCTMMGFLARWARRLSWRETAQAFQTSWEAVYRSVEWFVEWGLAHRELGGVEAIGVDEIHWGRGLRADNFLTVIYQIDRHCRRLLWVGRRRSQATLRRGLKALGPEVVKGLHFVCSDMWKPYLQVIVRAPAATRSTVTGVITTATWRISETRSCHATSRTCFTASTKLAVPPRRSESRNGRKGV